MNISAFFSLTMKGGMRIILCVAALLFFSLYLLEAHVQDICNQYHAGAYLFAWIDRKLPGAAPPAPPPIGVPGDKVIVMARLEEEDVSWVEEELPE